MQQTVIHVDAPAADQDSRWQALVARSASADGTFVYGVRTTGVYCRPSCPARRARPENVTFFSGCAEAEVAGYRACLRCRPRAATAAAVDAPVALACRQIAEAETPPSLAALADAAGLSPSRFHRRFKAATGITPKQYAVAHRARRLRERLADPGATVTQAIYESGFGASSRFYTASGAMLGMTPTAARGGGAGERIRFAVGQCSLGAILVASSEAGVCAIMLGNDPGALVADLQARFHRAELVGGDAGFEQTVATVVGFVEAPRLGLDLPLDIRGTAFQQRVWQALRAIPPGETVSYAELARRIGVPRAIRAVAGACAGNAIAVAIPCHRVVRTGGALSGYRWGVDRKRALLARERG